MDTKVHCIHCSKKYLYYLYKEASVVNYPDDDEPLAMCKHYPECDGYLIDMMKVELYRWSLLARLSVYYYKFTNKCIFMTSHLH